MVPTPSSGSAPDSPRQLTRRTVLATTAAAAAGSLGGCLGILPGNDTTPDDGSTGGTSTATATPGPSLPGYTKWAYPQGTRDTKSEYTLRRWDPQAVINNEDAVAAGIRDGMDRAMVDLGVYLDGLAEPADVESLLVFDSNRIYKGPWSASEVKESVEAFLNVESAGEHAGFALYKNTKTGDALAVADGQFIAGRLPDDVANEMESPVEVVKLIIDTHAGDTPRFGEASTDFELLFDGTDAGYFNQAFIQPSPYQKTDYRFAQVKGKLAENVTLQLDGGATAGTFRLLFDSAESASEQTVQEFADEVPLFASWTDKSITQQHDRVFTITGTIQPE
jgi:hypothetical protein